MRSSDRPPARQRHLTTVPPVAGPATSVSAPSSSPRSRSPASSASSAVTSRTGTPRPATSAAVSPAPPGRATSLVTASTGAGASGQSRSTVPSTSTSSSASPITTTGRGGLTTAPRRRPQRAGDCSRVALLQSCCSKATLLQPLGLRPPPSRSRRVRQQGARVVLAVGHRRRRLQVIRPRRQDARPAEPGHHPALGHDVLAAVGRRQVAPELEPADGVELRPGRRARTRPPTRSCTAPTAPTAARAPARGAAGWPRCAASSGPTPGCPGAIRSGDGRPSQRSNGASWAGRRSSRYDTPCIAAPTSPHPSSAIASCSRAMVPGSSQMSSSRNSAYRAVERASRAARCSATPCRGPDAPRRRRGARPPAGPAAASARAGCRTTAPPSDWSLITTSNGWSCAASPASVVASSTGRLRVGIRTSISGAAVTAPPRRPAWRGSG